MKIRQLLKSHWRWILLVLLPLVVIVLMPLLPMREWVKGLAALAEAWGLWGALLFILANSLAVVLLVPASVFTVTAGLLYGLGRGCVVAHVGTIAGAAVAFLCGRYLVRHRVQKMLQENRKFAAVDRAIGRKGWKIVSLIRLSPIIPFMVQNYLYSVTSIRFWPYLITSAICTFPGTLLFVYVGAAGRYGVIGGDSEMGPLQWVLLGIGFFATIFGTFYIRKVAQRALAEDVEQGEK